MKINGVRHDILNLIALQPNIHATSGASILYYLSLKTLLT